ncbi:hypothetical protein LTR66_009852 [Elasticomyces elasticus]|nr:hypothetical protein LTR66_009852 [Elasticomyces elasticus]KAK4986590.1 hypothetical protein LTR50_005200 [Elasticomyces elasticus]
MCGRYALFLRPSEVRQRLQDQNMPSDDCPADDDPHVRQSYNFAPGYHGLVYRADVPDYGAGGHPHEEKDGKSSKHSAEGSRNRATEPAVDGVATSETKYKIQAMKWGLVPFWTKRAPDYGSTMKTINCRDDSLATNGGMWNTMKQRKRCVVIAQGFYEWLKKNGGREKIPHYVTRKDGNMMFFAGLWDCVKYEGQEEKLWTYTVITTDSNKQLKFLHDRMPVILEPGSEAIRTWLDPQRSEWSKELQQLLKPYDGELECYPVPKEVGKVGNNSPSFIVPIDSTDNKNNIANFFGAQKKQGKGEDQKTKTDNEEEQVKRESTKVEHQEGEERTTTTKVEDTENNAPLPKPKDEPDGELEKGIKREHDDDNEEVDARPHKAQKSSESPTKTRSKTPQTTRKTRSATSNGTRAKSPKASDGSAKITNFFGK